MNGTNGKLVSIIIQGGAVGIALVSLTFFFVFATKTVGKNTESNTSLQAAMAVQTAAINTQTAALKSVFKDGDVVIFNDPLASE